VEKLLTKSQMSNTSESTIPNSKKELALVKATHSTLVLKMSLFQVEVLASLVLVPVLKSAIIQFKSTRNHQSSIKLDQKDADKSRLTRPMLHQPSPMINHSSQELALVKGTQHPLELKKSSFKKCSHINSPASMSRSSRNHLSLSSMVPPTLT